MLIPAHRDRLTRFGFEWFEHYAQTHGCEVLGINRVTYDISSKPPATIEWE